MRHYIYTNMCQELKAKNSSLDHKYKLTSNHNQIPLLNFINTQPSYQCVIYEYPQWLKLGTVCYKVVIAEVLT